MLTLWQAKSPKECRDFDRHGQIGLHHLALKLRNTHTLTEVYERFQGLDAVEVEFAPEPLGKTGLQHMMCYGWPQTGARQ